MSFKIFRRVVGIFVLMFGCLVLLGFTNRDEAQRNALPNSDECKSINEHRNFYPDSNDESDLPLENSWRCANQIIRTKSIRKSGGALQRGLEFGLNFLEFNKKGTLRIPQQLADLNNQLTTGKHFLIVYIHGWRHDAGKNDSDVQKFRTLLAYSAQFIKQRKNGKAGNYSNHTVTGVYIAWPGRGHFDCKMSICSATTSPSIFGRKRTSDRIAGAIVKTIQEFSHTLKSHKDGKESKILVTGHSLGGNILVRGILDNGIVKKHLAEMKKGGVVEPVLGDLVVLFNPASEARNWVKIQQEVRGRMNLFNPNVRFGADNKTASSNYQYFSIQQKPILIALTSACSWPDFVKNSDNNPDLKYRKDGLIECDTANNMLFNLSRIATGKFSKIDRTAIGHLDPDNRCVSFDPKTKTCKKRPEGYELLSFGTTHEMEISVSGEDSTDRRTNLANAQNEQLSHCNVQRGWLAEAIKSPRVKASFGTGWSSGKNQKQRDIRINPELGIIAKIQHSIYRGYGDHRITTASDPFWNMRALDTASKNHNGFHSYPTWCVLNQLVLDDITAQ